MANPIVSYLVVVLVPLVVKTAIFVLVFRQRRHKVALLTCIILAGAPMIGSVVPIPLPPVFMIFVGVGVAVYILAQYTEVPLVPEGILIITGVELVARLLMYVLGLVIG